MWGLAIRLRILAWVLKYGDGGVDLSPIADLVKSEVFSVGAHLEVPQSILDAAPTDGLWGDDRNDEDQIGASYPELEIAMKQDEGFKAGNGSPDDLTGREARCMLFILGLTESISIRCSPYQFAKFLDRIIPYS